MFYFYWVCWLLKVFSDDKLTQSHESESQENNFKEVLHFAVQRAKPIKFDWTHWPKKHSECVIDASFTCFSLAGTCSTQDDLRSLLHSTSLPINGCSWAGNKSIKVKQRKYCSFEQYESGRQSDKVTMLWWHIISIYESMFVCCGDSDLLYSLLHNLFEFKL